METTASDSYDRCNKNVSQNALRSTAVTAAKATDIIRQIQQYGNPRYLTVVRVVFAL